jgi:hypothetical protein
MSLYIAALLDKLAQSVHNIGINDLILKLPLGDSCSNVESCSDMFFLHRRLLIIYSTSGSRDLASISMASKLSRRLTTTVIEMNTFYYTLISFVGALKGFTGIVEL